MESNMVRKPALCPRCGQRYAGRPAISRLDGSVSICPDCGVRETLESIGVGQDEQDKILRVIHRSQAYVK